MKKEKSQLKIGIVLSYVNIIVGNLIPLFYTPVMLSLLGQNEYGLYKLSSSVTSYLGLISFGIGSALTRYLIKANTEEGKEAEERVLGLFMVFFQVIAGLTLLVGIGITFFLPNWYGASLTDSEMIRMRILVAIMTFNTALSFSASPYISVVNSHERFVFLQCMNIVSTSLGPICNLIALFLGFASIGMAVSSLALSVVTRLLFLIYVRKYMGIRARYKNLPLHLGKEIFAFSFWIFLGNLVSQLYNSTDTLLIGAVPALATSGVAIYHIGNVFSGMVFNATTVASGLLSPKTNKMVFSGASRGELTDLAIRAGRIQGYIVALLSTGFVAFGRPFIEFYAGDGYQEAYWVAIFVMIPSLIPLVQSVCLSIIVAQNKHKFRSLVYLGIAILNVVGTWFLMKPFGVVGAALMTGIATIIGQGFAMNWYYWKKTGLEIGRFWKEVGKLYIIPIVMCAVTLLISQWINFYNIGIFIVGVLLYTGIYVAASWKFIMNSYEKDLLRQPVIKVIGLFKRKNKG